METREQLIDQALAAQRRLLRAAHEAGAGVWLNLDLTTAQLKALFALTEEGPATIGRIAEILGFGLPNASHLVDRLVQAGLAVRTEDPSDRRRTLARLAPAGEELVTRLRQGSRDQVRSWLLELDEDDLRAYVRGLRALTGVALGETAGDKRRSIPSAP